ncbi:MAG TPA: hypothetical protein VK862_16210, partial [Afifellaceae bacterium]|nr:hypothetical protein [Afifellaceae bacterium]
PYSVFGLPASEDVETGDELGDLSFEEAQDALATMQDYSATVLELAATIHWLSFVEHVDDWRAELTRRKGVKADEGRADEAVQLLTHLGLQPED